MENSIPKNLGLNTPLHVFERECVRRSINLFNINPKSVGPYYFLPRLMEELGELAGCINKLQRGFNEREKNKLIAKWDKLFPEGPPPVATEAEFEGIWKNEQYQKTGTEIADLFIHLILLAESMGIDLLAVAILKFNHVNNQFLKNEQS